MQFCAMIMPLLLVLFNKNSGLYNINRKIVNDASRVIRMTIVTDAPGCGITYDYHSDNCRGVIYAPREHL